MQTLIGYIGKAYPMVSTLLKSRTDKFQVLNHGDCWNNNMLFKFDPETRKITDHIFVDLQVKSDNRIKT